MIATKKQELKSNKLSLKLALSNRYPKLGQAKILCPTERVPKLRESRQSPGEEMIAPQWNKSQTNRIRSGQNKSIPVRASAGSLVKEEKANVFQKPKVIMVLSNTKDLRRIIQLSLEEIAGWQVFVANLDAQDLTLVTVVQPDVILLDTKLPSSNELCILRQIQKYPDIQHIPRVLLTERIFSSDRKLYNNLGLLTTISKPCDMVTLATLISQRLNWNWHNL